VKLLDDGCAPIAEVLRRAPEAGTCCGCEGLNTTNDPRRDPGCEPCCCEPGKDDVGNKFAGSFNASDCTV
jgi:hypothetical protein